MAAVSTALFFSTVTCMMTITSGTYFPGFKYVSGNCGSTILVKSDVIIQLSLSATLSGNSPCSVTLKPYDGTAVVATFLTYYMYPSYVSNYGNCPTESIQMTDYSGKNMLGYATYCASQKPSGQINLQNQGTFGYTIAANQYPLAATLQLLVSEVVFKQGSCPSGYFDCRNNNCVKQDVTCNAYDDCGNNRDETVGCGIVVSLDIGVIVGIAVGVTVFVIVIVVLSLIFRRYRRRITYVQHT